MNRTKTLIFDAAKINKRTGLYEGIYKKDIKSFINIKIANEKKLGRLDQVVKFKRDLAKIDKWAARNDRYGKKRLLNYFESLPVKLKTPIIKEKIDKEHKKFLKENKLQNTKFYIEFDRIKANPYIKEIQKKNLKDLKQSKSVKDYLKDQATLKKIIKTTPRKKHRIDIIPNDINDFGIDFGDGYEKFDNIIKDMGGLQNAIELYSNTIDRKAEIYSVDIKLYASLFD